MKYTVLVTGPVYGTQNASTAFLFCQSLIKMNHALYSVFFYCDGVLNGNDFTEPATDEFNLVKGWQELFKNYNVQLHVCVGAALRRGVINYQNKSNLKIKKKNLACFFQLSGLVELGYSIQLCDRIVQF
ncbi:sulfurtransferase complex subunit TusD [Buchnera aphidicola]|nr:sulfurtransferase complex subunit TusD [Buchnera aphidicola]